MKKRLIIKAPAKINLGLSVLGCMANGYHRIESVMQQVSLADTILLEASPDRGFHFYCTDPELAGPDNLVSKAAALLERSAGKKLQGVKITLYKNIPVEAGLAGGSSDAAAALLGLNYYWQLGIDHEKLMEIGEFIGSDVPYCLQGGTALVGGRGEKVQQLPSLPFFWVVLAVPPGVRVSTAEAYRTFDRARIGEPSIKTLVGAINENHRDKVKAWLEDGLTNTLETADLPGLRKAGYLKNRLQKLGLQPVLSGSGPTLFILADNLPLACSALRAVEEEGGRTYLCWTLTENRSDLFNV